MDEFTLKKVLKDLLPPTLDTYFKDDNTWFSIQTTSYESTRPKNSRNKDYYEDDLVVGNKVQHKISKREGTIVDVDFDMLVSSSSSVPIAHETRVLVKWLGGKRSWVDAKDVEVV